MRRSFILLMLFPAAAQAQALEALPTQLGNLPPGFYPPPPCAKPVMEEDQTGIRALADSPSPTVVLLATEDHHRRVEKYNRAATAFNDCAKTYIQKSRYDIE